MTTLVSLHPCFDPLTDKQFLQLFAPCAFTIRLEEATRSIFEQISDFLEQNEVACPHCHKRVRQVSPVIGGMARCPLTPYQFTHIEVSPLTLPLRAPDRTTVPTTIQFKRVEWLNITESGRRSRDGGETYRRLADLVNDRAGLVAQFGLYGYILPLLPTAWRIQDYVDNLQRANVYCLTHCNWILTNGPHTIGLLKIEETDRTPYQVPGRVLLVDLLLHSAYQNRGVATGLTHRLFDRFSRLHLDIDGFALSIPVASRAQSLAARLHFTPITLSSPLHFRQLPPAT